MLCTSELCEQHNPLAPCDQARGKAGDWYVFKRGKQLVDVQRLFQLSRFSENPSEARQCDRSYLRRSRRRGSTVRCSRSSEVASVEFKCLGGDKTRLKGVVRGRSLRVIRQPDTAPPVNASVIHQHGDASDGQRYGVVVQNRSCGQIFPAGQRVLDFTRDVIDGSVETLRFERLFLFPDAPRQTAQRNKRRSRQHDEQRRQAERRRNNPFESEGTGNREPFYAPRSCLDGSSVTVVSAA